MEDKKLKQNANNTNAKASSKKQKTKKTLAYYMQLKESKKGISCDDKKCPYHGNLSVHGRILFGKVKKVSLGKNAYIQWNWLRFIPKYERYEKKTSTVVAHIPSCIEVNKGDNVYIAETRKLSKTKNFVVMEVVNDQ